MKFKFTVILFSLIISQLLSAQVLKKKYANGFGYKMLTDEIKNKKAFIGAHGVLVEGVLPNSTAESAGIKDGDIIVEINRTVISDEHIFSKPPLSEITEGTTIEYKIWRDTTYFNLITTAKAKVHKSTAGISYEYDEIKTSFGYLRTLISRPTNAKSNLPAIIFIQGNTCESVIDISEQDPYEQFCNSLTLQGYAVMRIDKPGAGDSEGRLTTCNKMSFNQELEQYQTGLDYLKRNKTIDTKRIFIFGHSMGGIIAPILASKNSSIKGVIVYGTLTTKYGNYLPKIVERSLIQSGNSREVALNYKNNISEITHGIFDENKSPTQIIIENPAYGYLLHQVFRWNEKDTTILNRSLNFNRELNKIEPKDYWEKVSCPVLSIYGTSDFEAIDKEYATAMIGWTNANNAKQSKAIVIEDTDHAFAKVGSMEEGIKLKYSGKYSRIMQENFNPLIVKKAHEWIISF